MHNTWAEPEAWRPERFLPGGEYSSFPEGIRPFMARARLVICGSAGNCVCPSEGASIDVCHRVSLTVGVWQLHQSLHLTDVVGAASSYPAIAVLRGCGRAQFVPFIQGPRNCLGQYFALLEARIVIALLVKVSPGHGAKYIS